MRLASYLGSMLVALGLAAGCQQGDPAAPNSQAESAPAPRTPVEPERVAEAPADAVEAETAAPPETPAAVDEASIQDPPAAGPTEVAAAPEPAPAKPSATKTTAPAPPFAFADDALGQQLQAGLTPPRQSPLDPTPFLTEPEPRQALQFDPLPRQLAPLPAPPARSLPHHLPLAVAGTTPLPVVDLPPVGFEPTPAIPEKIRMPSTLRSYAAAPDVAAAPTATAAPQADPVLPTTDPTRQQAVEALLLARRPAGTLPAPFSPLALPDPFALRKAAEFREPAEPLDPPLASPIRPSPPAATIELPVPAK